MRPKDIDREIATANVLIPELVQVNDALLDRAPALRLVQTGAGYNNVNLDACTRHGVIACNAAGVNANAVAEHVMAFILCWYKNLIYLNGFMKSHRDERELDYSGSELFGKTRPSIELTSLEGLCRRSDIVSVHVPLTEGAWRMINADVFRMIKGDSILINTSRGAAVDEAQLVQALKSGKISGACLDVYEEEPLTQDSLLRDMYRVILTPSYRWAAGWRQVPPKAPRVLSQQYQKGNEQRASGLLAERSVRDEADTDNLCPKPCFWVAPQWWFAAVRHCEQ